MSAPATPSRSTFTSRKVIPRPARMTPMGFFERLGFGWRLGMTSLGVVARDKTLMLFPILSGITSLLLVAAFVLGIGPENLAAQADQTRVAQEIPPVYYLYAFAIYFGL